MLLNTCYSWPHVGRNQFSATTNTTTSNTMESVE
jgi:hypothetical protein